MSEQAGRYQRSFAGMVGSMLVLLLVVAGFVLFRDVNRSDPDSPVEPIEWEGPAEFAREEADFPLLAPERLPEDWIATSIRFGNGENQTWHLGMLTGDRRYVGLEQTTDSADTMVEDFVDEDADPGPDVVVAGDTWQSWTDQGGDLALVREDPEVTTLVVGRVSEAVLEELILSLR